MVTTRQEVSLARAGAVAQYYMGSSDAGFVLFCGGRNGEGVHRDCIRYHPEEDSWEEYGEMAEARDESSVALSNGQVYVLGGVDLASVEVFDPETESWTEGPIMPRVVARGCAVSIGDESVVIIGEEDTNSTARSRAWARWLMTPVLSLCSGGHDNVSTNSLPTVYKLDPSTKEWLDLPEMNHPRRDHACLYVELEETDGILVTGGKKLP